MTAHPTGTPSLFPRDFLPILWKALCSWNPENEVLSACAQSVPPTYLFPGGAERSSELLSAQLSTCSAQPGRSLRRLEQPPPPLLFLGETWSRCDPQETASRCRSFTSRDKAKRRDWRRERLIYWSIFLKGFPFQRGGGGGFCVDEWGPVCAARVLRAGKQKFLV